MRSVLMGLLAFVTTPGPTEESPLVQYKALVKEFDTAYKAASEGYSKATTDDGRMAASLQRPQPQERAPRFFALADKYPQDPVAIDALTWVASKCLFGPQSEKALGILARDSPAHRDIDLRACWGVDEATQVVLYVGRLAPEKI